MNLLYVFAGSLSDAAPYIPLALALVWTLRYQRIADLSLGASFAFAAGLFANSVVAGWPLGVCIFVALAAGACVGLTVGVAANYLEVDGLLAGIVALFVFYGVSLAITQGTLVIPSTLNPLFRLVGLEREMGVQEYFLLQMLSLMAVGAVSLGATNWLLRSEWGCAFRALQDTRGGRKFLRSVGVSPELTSIYGFVLAGVLAAGSGVMLALQSGQATTSLGLDALIEVFPAYLLGVGLLSSDVQGTKRNGRAPGRSQRVSTEIAAVAGVFGYFFIVGAFHLITPARWAPRVLVGGVVLALLGWQGAVRQVRNRRLLWETTVTTPDGGLVVKNLDVEFVQADGVRHQVLSTLSLRAERGELVEVVGENGAGKSTLLRALSGRIVTEGQFILPVGKRGRHRQETRRDSLVLYLPQDARDELCAGLTALEHWVVIACGPRASCWKVARTRGSEVLSRVVRARNGLDPNQSIETLSGGQKRRVLLGRLELADYASRVAAVDEPFADLDRDGIAITVGLLNDFTSRGGIVLIVDHAQRLAPDRRYSVRGGKAREVPVLGAATFDGPDQASTG